MSNPAENWKNKGNAEYSAKQFNEAVHSYTKAISLATAPGTQAVYYTNRSAAFAGLGQWDKSLQDAVASTQLNPQWVKGYFRQGIAYLELKRVDESIQCFKKAISLEPNNADLPNYLRNAEQAKQKTSSNSAQNFFDSVPVQKSAAPPAQNFATPAQNFTPPTQAKPAPQAAPTQSQAKPASPAPPTAQNKGGAANKAKEEGNELFKAGNIEKAIDAYTRAISLSTDPAEKATILSNRAACFVQLYEPTKVVADCTESLTLVPNNAKALIRRGLAYESLEKYKLAVEDLRKVVTMDPSASVAQQAINRIQNALKAQGIVL